MIISYCRKCKLESQGAFCQGCGKPASQKSQFDRWSTEVIPLRDGRIWRSVLLTSLGVAVLLLVVILGMEMIERDGQHALLLLEQSPLPHYLLLMIAVSVLLAFLFLLLQGRETAVYILGPKGAHLQTWHSPFCLKSWVRLQSSDRKRDMVQSDGTVVRLSQERHMRWQDVADVRFLPEKGRIYLYHTPHCAPMILRIPADEYDLAAKVVNHNCKNLIKKKQRG